MIIVNPSHIVTCDEGVGLCLQYFLSHGNSSTMQKKPRHRAVRHRGLKLLCQNGNYSSSTDS